MSFNHSDSTITIATCDSLLIYSKSGTRIPSFFSRHADDFQGWYIPDSQFLSHESYKNIHIRNIYNNSDLLSFKAYQGNARTNNIVLVRNDSLFTYPDNISHKTPLEPKAVIWVNDSIVAFCGEFETNICIHNLNSDTTSIVTDAYVDKYPTFSISPDLKWVIYAECNFSEDITPLVIKEIKYE